MELKKIKAILTEFRIKHWVKNLIVFMAAFFNGSIYNTAHLFPLFLVFAAFCLTASAVYTINDLVDIDLDRAHKDKKNRPIASGQISRKEAIILVAVLLILSLALLLVIGQWDTFLVLGIYFVANLLYSFKLKNVVLWDIFFVSGMYLIRLYAGSIVTDITVSGWLFVTVFFGSLLIILGKRYSEMRSNKLRPVLNFYTPQLLSSFLLLTSAVTTTAFTIYSINLGIRYVPAVVIFTFAIFRYFFILETTLKGEKPETILVQDKQMLLSIIALVIYNGYLIYFNH